MNHKKIYHSNFRDVIEFLPEETLIITDPPYNIGYKYLEYKDQMSEYEYGEMFQYFSGKKFVSIHYPEETIKYIIPAMGLPTEIVSWCYHSNMGRQHRMIAWFNCVPDFSKVKQLYKNPKDKRVKKLIAGGSNGTNIYDWWEIDLVKNVSDEKENYTNQIPEEVIARIIKTTAHKDYLIFDPFSGSGTTCAVAEKLGFDWIGTDISRAAVDISQNRLNNIAPLFR